MRHVKRVVRFCGHWIDKVGLFLQEIGTRMEFGWAWEGHEIYTAKLKTKKKGDE